MSRPIIPDLGTVPHRQMDDAVYSPVADAFMGALPPWGASANSLGSWMESVGAAVESAAINAAAAAAAAAASSNFKGAWSAQTGSMAKPASVSTDDAVWLLLDDVADVTAHEPGISAVWLRMFTLGVARFAVVEVADDYMGAARQWVEQTANNKTVWMPEAPPPGTEFGFGIKGAVTGAVLDLNGSLFEGEDIGHIEWDGPPNSGRPFLYVSAAVGWRVA